MGVVTASAVQNLGGNAIKPEGWDRTGFEAFKYFLYNPRTGEILSRTPLSWVKITIFYIIYYFCLAVFWLSCLQVFFLTLPDIHDGPKWTQEYGIIGRNPGVGVRPQNINIDSQMFVLNQRDNSYYTYQTQRFLESYQKQVTKPYHVFDLADLSECGIYPYGYGADLAPCIFIKLNKIWGWEPSPITYSDDLYGDVSEGLRAEVLETERKGGTEYVWIDCDGRYAADKEAIQKIEYFPSSRGMPVKYFPYTGNSYHSPLVAIKIHPKTASIGQLIHMECRAHHYEVIHDTKDKLGLVQFELLIEPRDW